MSATLSVFIFGFKCQVAMEGSSVIRFHLTSYVPFEKYEENNLYEKIYIVKCSDSYYYCVCAALSPNKHSHCQLYYCPSDFNVYMYFSYGKSIS